MLPKTSMPLIRYGVALIATSIALLITNEFHVLHDRFTFMLPFAAVLFSAWFGGAGPGIISVGIVALASSYFFLPPNDSFAIENPLDGLALFVFVVVALFIVLLTATRRRAMDRVSVANQTLKQEIVERKHAEEALAESEKNLSDFFETATIGLHWVGPDGIVLRVNKAELDLLGYTAGEYLGHHIAEFHVDRAVIDDILDRLARDERLNEYPAKLRRKDGSIRHVLINSSVLWENGQFIHTRCITRDVTEQMRAEEQIRRLNLELEQRVAERTRELQDANHVLAQQREDLTRTNAELERFAYVSSHDLREPLRMITSYLKLLVQRYGGRLDSDADAFIGYAVDGAQRMDELVRDLLELARLGSRSKIDKTDCNMVLHRGLVALHGAMKESGAVVTYDPLPTVMADQSQMAQLFQNLIGNAIKFRGKESPRIHVSAGREGQDLIFAIRDNGIGIEAQYLERIFVVFQRLHRRDEYPGTGIGLSICKKVVEGHGGRIWVESDPGSGSTFYFTLPADAAVDADVVGQSVLSGRADSSLQR